MLLLASSSPRRRELLAQAGIPFLVDSLPVPEDRRPGEDPSHLVQRLAREKATAVFHARAAEHSHPDQPLLVLGADTLVIVDDQVLGKPADDRDAARMLRLLAGRTHQVLTGVCLISSAQVETAVESTWVTLLSLSDEEIRAYVATGEPAGKAGAYAIQGLAGRFIPRIAGCYFNVVGLPLALVTTMMEAVQKKFEPANTAG